MPQAFLNLTPELEAACTRSVVLTSTERLARNLLKAYHDRQLDHGRQAWRTPRVFTFETYLGMVLARQRSAGASQLELIGSEAEFVLFHETAPPNGARLIGFAREAWQLSHQWGLEFNAANFAATENGRFFLDWVRSIQAACTARGVITRAELSGLETLLAPDQTIACLGFENLPTSYQRWLARQRAAGIEVRDLSTASAEAVIQRTVFETPAQELAAVSRWAAGIVQRQPAPRIGIVVPDLAGRYTAIVHQLTAELDPLLEDGIDGLIDVGGGLPLSAQPIWQSALGWLRLCADELPVQTLAALTQSRYLSLPEIRRWPESLLPFVRLDDLPGLKDLTDESVWPREAPLRHWLERFRQRLEQAGWSADKAGSVQYQAWQEISDVLEQLNRQPGKLMTANDALKLVDACLADVTFAPSRAAAPIQVMGYLETTGLSFSDLWVVGLDDGSWPAAARANPFLPTAARVRQGVPRTTPADETAFARERLQHWRHAADRLVLSHARAVGESVCRPSPLIRAYPEVSLAELREPAALPFITPGTPRLEAVADLAGLPAEPGSRRGGTRLLRDQALCPFRGYAIHRLGLDEPRQPHALPDPLDRGILVHEALHQLYLPVRTGEQPLATLDHSDFADAAERAVAKLYRRFPEAFRTREQLRLIRLLAAWHELDSGRGPIEVENLESEHHADFDGIQLRLRVDRVDRIGERLVVIDYKTGRVASRLNESRLTEPQLPMYALSDKRISAVLYAEVDEQRPRLTGMAAPDLEIAGVQLVPSAHDWQRQREIWRAQIHTLTLEIKRGWAAVTPESGSVCERCHLGGLCRIGSNPAGPAGRGRR